MAVDGNKWTRGPRSHHDHSRSSNHQHRGTTVGLSFDPNHNSDDDFSMESWKRRALASSKTPKMSNLTTDVLVTTVDEEAVAAVAALRTTTSNNYKNDHSHSQTLQQPEPQQQSKQRPISDAHNKSKVDRQASVHAQQTKARRSQQENPQPEQPKLSVPLLEPATTKPKLLNHAPKTSRQDGSVPPASPILHKGFRHSPRRRLRSTSVVPMAVTTVATETVVDDDKNNDHSNSAKKKVETTIIKGRNTGPDNAPQKSPILEQYSTVRVDKRTERRGTLNNKKNDDLAHHEDDMDCASSDDSCLKSSSSSSVSPTDERKKVNGTDKDRQEKAYSTKIQACPPPQIGLKDRHNRRKTLVPPSSPAPSMSSTSVDGQVGFLQRTQQVENGEFFCLMMNSTTPTTAKRDGELLGATIGEDDRFLLHDDNSEITAFTRASKTPPKKSGALSAGRNPRLTQKSGRGYESFTSPLIENLPFVEHHNKSGSKDDDEVSIEAWSMDGNTALPFQFKVNGKVFGHAPLPPGWKMKLSRTKKIPVYFHPDHGRTWYCPVVLPHKSMNMVYTRSSLRTIDVPELESPQLDQAESTSSLSQQRKRGASLTPPSPPSTAHKLPFQSHHRRHSAPPVVLAGHPSVGTPPSHFEKPRSSGKVESEATVKHQSDVLESSLFQSGPETSARRAMSGEHRPFLDHTTPLGQGGALHAQSSQKVNKASDQQTPGTMSDVVNSYERDKGLVATALLSVQNNHRAGYDCDVSGCSGSSSSLSSMDPRVLKLKATPRSKSKLLARLYQTKGEWQLSPIRENPEHPPANDTDYLSPGGVDEIQQEDEEQRSGVEGQDTTEASELPEESHSWLQHPKTPLELSSDIGNTRSSQSSTSKQRVASGSSKQSEKSTEKEINTFRTPNDTTPKKNGGNRVLEEVAVVRHASNRKKKHEKPLLSTGKNNMSSKQKKVKFSEASTTKPESPNFSPLVGHNDEWSPLVAPGSRNCQTNQGNDPKHYLNSANREVRTKTPKGLSTGKLPLVAGSSGSKQGKWKSPNCSGIEPSSGEESFHSPYRSDIQTPAVNGPEINCGSDDEADQPDSQLKTTKPRSKLHLDQTEATLEVESAQKPNDRTITEASTEPESPVVFDTFGDDGSEGSMETPTYRGPDEKRLLSSSRRVQNVSTGRRTPLYESDISEADEDDRGRFNDDESGQSFRMVEKSPNETIYDSLMAVHTPKPSRQMSWRILHPPHPICSLQRLDEIFARTKNAKPNAKRSKSKPKVVKGRKTNATKRAYSSKKQKTGRKRRNDN